MRHGHVIPNPDGSKARCGGPGICSECALEQVRFNKAMQEAVDAVPPPKQGDEFKGMKQECTCCPVHGSKER